MKKNFLMLTVAAGKLALFALLFLSLVSFSKKDSSLYSSDPQVTTGNLVGVIGTQCAEKLHFAFGLAAYVIVICLLISFLKTLNLLRYDAIAVSKRSKTFAYAVIVLAAAAIFALYGNASVRFDHGGLCGYLIGGFFMEYLGPSGSLITLGLLFLLGLAMLWTEPLFAAMAKAQETAKVAAITAVAKTQEAVSHAIEEVKHNHETAVAEKAEAVRTQQQTPAAPVVAAKTAFEMKLADKPVVPEKPAPVAVVKPTIEPKAEIKAVERPMTITQAPTPAQVADTIKPIEKPITITVQKAPAAKPVETKPTVVKSHDYTYTLPTSDILSPLPPFNEADVKKEIEKNAAMLEATLQTFEVNARVVNADRGPTVTRYELELAPGVKINRVANLADDIAMAMHAAQVRIVAPIPGKGTVGVELPNEIKKIVYMRECIENPAFMSMTSPTAIALGQDVAGNPLVADIREMPHMLIAGSTGAGKTVCINTLICSLLCKSSPWDLKFIMVDPKMVEMTQYADIPHLFAPIVTDAKKAAAVLIWAVEEMERRYKQLAAIGARNIGVYNEKKPREERMPYVVIIVDELADLMMVARDQIETSIARIAQLARAVGIHLVLATQRPSADIITGVIKNNLPARIAFKVPTQIDSRVILDHTGAEKLLGKGDMLYLGPGLHKPIRAQACYMKDEDIEKIVEFIKDQNIPLMYNEKILEAQNRAANNGIGNGERDELLDDAVKIVLETGQASASILQRRMRVGYNRAARLIDQMENEGIVGPFQGSKPRTILVDPLSFMAQQIENAKPDAQEVP